MLPYTKMFMETCFTPENQERLMQAFGAALYRDASVMGKVFVLYGGPGTGKSSILLPFMQYYTDGYWDRNIQCRDDANLFKLNDTDFEALKNNKYTTYFMSTCKLPDKLPDNFEVIYTSGKRMPYEDYKMFVREMDVFSNNFFYKCMATYGLAKKYGEELYSH